MSTLPAEEAASYRFWAPERVRFSDLDPLGHVNNTAIAVYVETGRGAFLSSVGVWVPGSAEQSVVARLEIDYRRELLFPADVAIGVRVLQIGRSSYRIGCGLFAHQQCVATAVSVVVGFDTVKRCSKPLDDATRTRLEAYL